MLRPTAPPLSPPLPSQEEPLHPGRLLQERFLTPLQISVEALADGLGLPLEEVDRLLEGLEDLTPLWAIRLGFFFDVPAWWWLEMQGRYALSQVRDKEAIRAAIKPCPALQDTLITPKGAKRFQPSLKGSPQTLTCAIPPGLLESLQAQVQGLGTRPPREVHEIQYPDGSRALIGKDS